jgi:putative lipoic acid-binding regulatory protein
MSDIHHTFTLKVVSQDSPQIKEKLFNLVQSYHANVNLIKTTASQKANYLALTFQLSNIDQGSLDQIYQALTNHRFVQWVL